MNPDFLDQILQSDFAVKLIGFVIAIQILLYGLGEFLTRIAVHTENKWDNKLGKILSDTAWYVGVVISKFGYSVPKLVIEEKKKKSDETSNNN